MSSSDNTVIDVSLLCETVGNMFAPFLQKKAELVSVLVVLKEAIEQETDMGHTYEANLCSSLYLLIEDALYG